MAADNNNNVAAFPATVAIPHDAIAELIAGPCGPVLQNFLVVLSSANATLSRDGSMMRLPFDDLMSASIACALEAAARSYFAMGERAGKRASYAEFNQAAAAISARVAEEFTGLVVPGGAA